MISKKLAIVAIFFFGTSIFTYASTCTTLTKNLSKGSENSEVLTLQQFLFDDGYLTAKPNGYFGNGTVAAVKRFQSKNGVAVTGTIGPVGRAKIKELSCKSQTQSNSIKDSQKSTAPIIGSSLQETAKKTETVVVKDPSAPKPTLTVSASPTVAEANTSSIISWNSSNTTECSVVGKGQGAARAPGEQKWGSNDQQEVGTGGSLLTAKVTCNGKNGEKISKEIFVRIKSANEPTPSAKQNEPGVRRYEIYMSRHLGMISYLTKAEAVDHCEMTHKNNPKNSIECVWGVEKIYSFFNEADIRFLKDQGISTD